MIEERDVDIVDAALLAQIGALRELGAEAEANARVGVRQRVLEILGDAFTPGDDRG